MIRDDQKGFYVYILASLSGTLYVGLTDDLKRRMREHQDGLVQGFTKKYRVDRLIYFEVFCDSEAGALREKQIKKYRREKKIALFARSNPHWRDLSGQFSVSWKEVLM
jgi:putative endonuclease